MQQIKNFLKNHGLLILLISVVYLPFMGSRLVRTTGDEKVYITQALEMMKNGSWFLQVLGEVPDYYKGPGHLVLIQLGVKLFGYGLWAALYMNLFIGLLGAVSIAELVRRVYPEKKYWGLWAGSFFALNVGVSGHLFASQMEVELAGLYSLGLFLLWRSKNWKGDLLFWLVAGSCGWFKSPIHSVLIGVSAVLFWLWTGEIWKRVLNYRAILAALAGIAFCAAGFAPAFFLDQNNFLSLYIQKETFKNSNGGPWWQAMLPMFSYYLIPWMSLAVVVYFETVAGFFFNKNSKTKLKTKTAKESSERSRFFKLSVSGMAPTMAFFTYYFYRGENYALPVVAFVVCFFFYFLQKTEGLFPKLRKVLIWLGALWVLPIAGVFTAIHQRFDIPTLWWPSWVVPLVWVLSVFALLALLWDHKKREAGLGIGVCLSKASFVVVMNLVLLVFGEMEVYQLKDRVRQDRAAGEHYRVTYWNLNRLIWNESGLMSLTLGEPITPLYKEAQLLQAIEQGDLILGRDTDVGKEIIALAKAHFPQLEPTTYTWERWKTHAADGAGNSLVPKAWKERDLSVLFDHALILRFKPRPT